MENIKIWIENLGNPLVLIGFVVLVLTGVISLFIRRVKPDQNQNISGENNVGNQAGGDLNNAHENKK